MDIQKELLMEFDQETASTRRMLDAIPADVDFGYKPHEKSMSLGRLAGHVAETPGQWALLILNHEKLELAADHKWEQYAPTDKVAMLAKYDEAVAGTRASLAAMTAGLWDSNWKFIYGGHTVLDGTKLSNWRICVLSHMIHHRAQLGLYLRLLGAKIPGMYGPSADEG